MKWLIKTDIFHSNTFHLKHKKHQWECYLKDQMGDTQIKNKHKQYSQSGLRYFRNVVI